jgi:isoquinoline 1-oxidoreductase beta subunit
MWLVHEWPDHERTCPLLTMQEAPAVEAILVDTGAQEAAGVGILPVGHLGAAIANALFALTGQRPRQTPLTLK